MKYIIPIIIILVILLLITTILRNRSIEAFQQNNCTEDKCPSPNLWYKNVCFAPCPENTYESSMIPITCVPKDENGNLLPFTKGKARPIFNQCYS